MTNVESLKRLEKDTKAYLYALRDASTPGDRFRVCLGRYVEAKPSLLERHMEYMKNDGRLPPDSEDCDTLVLLVGHSVEPLLQSIWAHEPQRLVLVFSPAYYGSPEDQGTYWDGRQFCKKLKGVLRKLPPEKCKWWDDADSCGDDDGSDEAERKLVTKVLTETTPAAVFQGLLKHVRTRRRVVIDITGAKKSMTAGAFLYAAYADVTVAYVDYDDDAYRLDFRAPYGHLCRIRHFSSPYHDFALRYWERVRSLYRRYKFRDARLLLIGEEQDRDSDTVVEAMKEYLPGSESAVQRLTKVLRCYELWDSGEYDQAADIGREVKGETGGFEPPAAVSVLGGKWFRVEGVKFEGGPSDFYEETKEEFKVYVYDEMARIERLIKFNTDYRSAFLRAASLNEVVMLARLVRLVGNHPEKGEMLRVLQGWTPPAKWVFKGLAKSRGSTVDVHKISDRLPEITVEITEEMSWWQRPDTDPFNGQNGWSEFIDRRNDLVHKYFSVPLEWAEGALAFVKANIEEFWGTQPEGMSTGTFKWSELCKLTGLEQYLPPNLCSGGDEKEEIQ